MNVGDLVKFLQTLPPDMDVAIQMYSEQRVFTLDEILVIKGCPPRPDGWIQNQRPDVEPQEYLLFPGN